MQILSEDNERFFFQCKLPKQFIVRLLQSERPNVCGLWSLIRLTTFIHLRKPLNWIKQCQFFNNNHTQLLSIEPETRISKGFKLKWHMVPWKLQMSPFVESKQVLPIVFHCKSFKECFSFACKVSISFDFKAGIRQFRQFRPRSWKYFI